MKNVKKTIFALGRIFTVSSAFCCLFILLATVYAPAADLLADTGVAGALNDGAAAISFTEAALLTAVSLVNILFFRHELPLYDHFLSLLQMPLMFFGVSTALEIASMHREGYVSYTVFLMVMLLLFTAIMLYSTVRYLFPAAKAKNANSEKSLGKAA